MTVHKNLKGAITISRPRGANTEYIEISLYDDSSGTEYASVRVDPANFAEALVGLGRVECEFTLRPDLVGKIHENKEEVVRYTGGWIDYNDREKVARKAFKEYEIDGWKGRVDDLFNQHRRTASGYRVTFVRYVDAPTTTNGDGK